MIAAASIQTSLRAEVISLGRLCPVVFEMRCSRLTVHLSHKATLLSLFICTLSTELNFEEGDVKTYYNQLAWGGEDGSTPIRLLQALVIAILTLCT